MRASILSKASLRPAWRTGLLASGGYLLLDLLVLNPSTSLLPQPPGWLDGLARLVPLGAAAWIALVILRQPLPARTLGAWRYLGAGLVLWVAGCALFTLQSLFYPSVLPAVPFSNLFILAGYPAFLVGLTRLMPQSGRATGRFGTVLDILITGIALTSVTGLLFLEPVLGNAAAGPEMVFWTVIFPLADFAALFVLLNLLLINEERQKGIVLALLAFAFAALALHDTAGLYFAIRPAEYLGGAWNAGFVLGTTLICLAGIVQLDPQITAGDRSMPPPALWQRVYQVLPLSATIVVGWVSLYSWRQVDSLNVLTSAVAVLCFLLLILRQGVTAGEYQLQQFAVLVNSVAEPVFICDEKGSLKMANPAFYAAAGLDAGEAITSCHLERMLDGAANSREILSAGQERGWSGEVALHRMDGTVFPAFLSLRPMRQQGKHRTLAGTAHDLTVLKQQQASLQQAYEDVAAARSRLEAFNANLESLVAEKTSSLTMAYTQLEQQNRTLQKVDELKSDFVSLVSHELRAPLTNISSGIELVLDARSNLPGSISESLDLVQAEIRRLSRFVESILDVSALDAGRNPFTVAPVALEPALLGLRGKLSNLPDISRIAWKAPAGLPYVLADEHALSSVFLHLIDNAIKYAPEGEIRIEVRPCADSRVRFEVTDSGLGFPPDALPLLFDKFFRVHQGDAQRVYGHGLGLYIVRRLLEFMGGEIRAENRIEGGARFVFWLRTAEEEDEPEDLDC